MPAGSKFQVSYDQIHCPPGREVFIVSDCAYRQWLRAEHDARHHADEGAAEDAPEEPSDATLERLRRAIRQLDARDADTVTLHLRGFNEERIARLLNVSQQAISHRLIAGRRKLRVLMALPELPSGTVLYHDLWVILRHARQTTVTRTVIERRCTAAEAARHLGLRQQTAAWHLMRARARIARARTERAAKYQRWFALMDTLPSRRRCGRRRKNANKTVSSRRAHTI